MKHYKIYKLERLEKRLNQQNHIEQNIFCSVKTIEHHGFRHCSAENLLGPCGKLAATLQEPCAGISVETLAGVVFVIVCFVLLWLMCRVVMLEVFAGTGLQPCRNLYEDNF